MSKPHDIPQDAWDAGLAVAEPINDATILYGIIADNAARAIMTERNRCAVVCRQEAETAKANDLTHEAMGALWCAKSIRKGAT